MPIFEHCAYIRAHCRAAFYCNDWWCNLFSKAHILIYTQALRPATTWPNCISFNPTLLHTQSCSYQWKVSTYKICCTRLFYLNCPLYLLYTVLSTFAHYILWPGFKVGVAGGTPFSFSVSIGGWGEIVPMALHLWSATEFTLRVPSLQHLYETAGSCNSLVWGQPPNVM